MKWHRFLPLFFLILFSSCDELDLFGHESLEKDPTIYPYHLNICVLGNSYAADAFSYLPFILKKYGVTSEIHLYYKGSGSLKDLDEQWNSTLSSEIAEGGGNHVRRYYHIDTRYLNPRWKRMDVKSAKDIVAIGNWDIITIQQYSVNTDKKDKYSPYLTNVVDSINTYCGVHPYKLAWFMAYNRATHDNPEKNIEVQHEIIQEYNFDMVLPVATAVFDARSIPAFAEMGASKYKNMWASDNVHLQEGLPCYIAALSIAEAILREYRVGSSILGNTIRPTDSYIGRINGITPNGVSIGVTDYNCYVAQEVAIAANDNKYTIQDLSCLYDSLQVNNMELK